MGEDCDDGVRSLWHSCLHSLLYEHGQGGQSLVIDHYHDQGYDHHTPLLDHSLLCSAENIVIVRNWVLAKKSFTKTKNAVGIHSLLMSNDRFFQRCQKTLGTWKPFETFEYLEVS